jgi:hypothetical protein
MLRTLYPELNMNEVEDALIYMIDAKRQTDRYSDVERLDKEYETRFATRTRETGERRRKLERLLATNTATN